jgi:DNA (cytosine-5)-methyltransferase 1
VGAPTVVDLFAGCGGMTEGFRRAGFEPVAAVEWNVHAAATYAANFGGSHVFCGDIADWRRGIPEADVVIGGPPCQGFSNLGTRDPDDPRNRLWREYVRVVRAARPKVFVIENVDRFSRSHEFALLLAEVKHGLLRDYDVTWDVLDAADYGVPQRRRRTIVIGSRVGPPVLPATSGARSTVRDAIAGLPPRPGSTSLPHRPDGRYTGLDLHLGRNPTPLSLERYACIPPGGGRFDLPDHLLPRCWREKPTGTTDVMGRLVWDEPSVTIRTEFFKPEKGRYLHPEEDRPITHLEAALLQTFPFDFRWCGTKLEIARQIGNAVPVGLAHAIACTVQELLEAA